MCSKARKKTEMPRRPSRTWNMHRSPTRVYPERAAVVYIATKIMVAKPTFSLTELARCSGLYV